MTSKAKTRNFRTELCNTINLGALIHRGGLSFIIGPVKQCLASRDLIYSLPAFLKSDTVIRFKTALSAMNKLGQICADSACAVS